MPEDLTIKSPVILDSTGLAIASALEKVAFLPQIVDNLTTADPTKPLSANMGKKLNDEKYEKPSTGIPATDLDSNVQASLGKADTAVQPEDIKPGAKYTSVTIAAADWSNGVCTKTVRGMNSNYVIILSADTNSVTDYISSDIKCVAQGTNSLTFSCGVTPTNSVTVNVLCFETEPLVKPTSLTISGDWTNTQYVGEPVDSTGLTFTAEYSDGVTSTVTPTSISPANWGSTVGTQTATFNYTEGGITVSASKAAEVEESGSETSIPLTLKAASPGNVSITKTGNPGTVYYSVNGVDQGELASNTNVPVNMGDEVSFFRTLSNNLDYSNFFKINCTSNCYVYGNVMSLYNKDNFSNLTTIGYSNAFCKLFGSNTHINIDESIGNLVLPATTLSNYCYYDMFAGCTSLTTAPTLPATTLAYGCYQYMFRNTGLTVSPTLPATTLADSCYREMFGSCTSLTTASTLPATTLTDSCYLDMFKGCTSLTTAPVMSVTSSSNWCCREMFSGCTSLTNISNISLSATSAADECYASMFKGCSSLTSVSSTLLPSTTLSESCYSGMFYNCTNLTTAPALPATTLATECYSSMFYGCTSLTALPTLPATTLAEGCYMNMFEKCTSITSIPSGYLPVTTLAKNCYLGMFLGCSSLASVPSNLLPATTLAEACYSCMFEECESISSTPDLPATTLATECYSFMFHQCYGLENVPSILPATTLAEGCYKGMFQESCAEYTYFGQSPILPATTLVKECYANMFYQCAELYSVTCLATDISAEDCVYDWLGNIWSSGTLFKAASMNDWSAGDNIPNDWYIEDYQG